MKPSRAAKLFSLFFAFCLPPVCAQEPQPPEPQPVRVPLALFSDAPMPMTTFTQASADILLTPGGPDARNGRLWIRTMSSGLFVAGRVDGGLPEFPRTLEQLKSKDHLELWLSGSPGVDLPPIGWGNQFDDTVLPDGPDPCSDWAAQMARPAAPDLEKACKDWLALQIRYRPLLRRLFVRRWLLSPDYSVESFATPAYEEIQKDFSKLGDDFPELLKPAGDVKMYLFPEQSGYAFEILIPFNAFPPLPSLTPDTLYLSFDVVSAASPTRNASARSTSSPARSSDRPDTFNFLRLQVPFFFSLSPCQLPLTGTDKRGNYHPAWFIPERAPGHEFESEAFILVNDPAGYRYDPAGLSPVVRTSDYFWKDAGQGEWICGPHLTYRKGGQSESFPDVISKDGFEPRRLPDGDLLIKTGPRVWYSEFGSGQCGACPRTDLRIFDLTRDFKLEPLLRLGDVVSNPMLFSQDFTVSQDWSQIVQFDLKQGDDPDDPDATSSWSSTTWCMTPKTARNPQPHHSYSPCGQKQNVQPPDPPVLKELRDVQY